MCCNGTQGVSRLCHDSSYVTLIVAQQPAYTQQLLLDATNPRWWQARQISIRGLGHASAGCLCVSLSPGALESFTLQVEQGLAHAAPNSLNVRGRLRVSLCEPSRHHLPVALCIVRPNSR